MFSGRTLLVAQAQLGTRGCVKYWLLDGGSLSLVFFYVVDSHSQFPRTPEGAASTIARGHCVHADSRERRSFRETCEPEQRGCDIDPAIAARQLADTA